MIKKPPWPRVSVRGQAFGFMTCAWGNITCRVKLFAEGYAQELAGWNATARRCQDLCALAVKNIQLFVFE